MVISYPYTVSTETNGKFFIQFNDFSTGVAEANSLSEVPNVAKEIIEGLVEVYNDIGLALPKASTTEGFNFVSVEL
jgi:predicted RNase H-like HicB family nuclease